MGVFPVPYRWCFLEAGVWAVMSRIIDIPLRSMAGGYRIEIHGSFVS